MRKGRNCLSSLQSRRNFGERVLSNFITKIIAAIFSSNDSERLGREINLYQGGDPRSKMKRAGGVGEPFPPPPTPTVHSNCKSNIAGRINDRELITLARTHKTPAGYCLRKKNMYEDIKTETFRLRFFSVSTDDS